MMKHVIALLLVIITMNSCSNHWSLMYEANNNYNVFFMRPLVELKDKQLEDSLYKMIGNLRQNDIKSFYCIEYSKEFCDSLWMVDDSGNHFVGAVNLVVSSKDPSLSTFDGFVDIVKGVGVIHDVKCMFIGLDSDIESLCDYRRKGKLMHYKCSSPFAFLPQIECCHYDNDGKIEHYPKDSYNTIPFTYY